MISAPRRHMFFSVWLYVAVALRAAVAQLALPRALGLRERDDSSIAASSSGSSPSSAARSIQRFTCTR
jgi:hypothetical protein